MLVNSSRPEWQKLSEVDAALLAAVDTLPLPKAAERLFELSGHVDAKTSSEVRGEAVLGEVLVRLDPYLPGFAKALDAALPFGSSEAVGKLLALFPAHPPAVALRQLWAVAAYRPVMAALLVRGVLSAPVAAAFPALAPEMRRLLAFALQAACGSHAGAHVLGAGPLRHSYLANELVRSLNTATGVPELGAWREAKPGLRLRFHLAVLSREQANAEELLVAATEIPGVTKYLVEREMVRAFGTATAEGWTPGRLPALQSVRLPLRAQRWLQQSKTLRSLVLEGAPRGYLSWSRKQQALHVRTVRLAERIKTAMSLADFAGAGKYLLALPSGPVADAVLREELRSLPNTGGTVSLAESRAARRWLPMSLAAVAVWQERVPGVALPAWWACSLQEVAEAVAAGRWLWAVFSPVERARLQASWQPAQERVLIAAGCFAALSPASACWRTAGAAVAFQLASQQGTASLPLLRKVVLGLESAQPLLEYVATTLRGEELRDAFAKMMDAIKKPASSAPLSWFRWEAPLIGTPEWLAAPVWMRNAPAVLSRMPGYLKRGGCPLHLPGYVAVFENELLAAPWPAQTVAQVLVKWQQVQPASAMALLEQLPAPVLGVVLKHRKLSAGFAEAVAQQLATADAPVSEDIIDTFRLRYPEHLEQVAAALWRKSGARGEAVHWNPAWNALPGAATLRDDCRLLLARSKARTVMALAREFGSERFGASARRVASRLAALRPREAAFLELAAPLVPAEIGSLWVALAKCRHGAPAGCLLDHTYRRYALPKQSGGTRTIHAPGWPVKAAQRAVLRAYLAPLGAHAAACGFVPGRSIADNAKPHVGQCVVANADVHQCFSSVSWSRVLGVLRRDLGARLSPAAIGLLVDLTTAEGALPTGAPTSPALLNRVLLRSDEMLSQLAAAHGVNYTRYADDLTFSGDGAAVKLLGHAKRVLAQVGLALDPKKTHIFRRGRRQMVTGLVVNTRVSVPRKVRRELRAAVHAVQAGHVSHRHGAPQSLETLRGRLAFLAMVHPAEARALAAQLPLAKAPPKSVIAASAEVAP